MMEDVVALILCGGKGERLSPLTRDRAKPAVPFAGIYRLIDFTLSNCINSGLRKIAVLTQYKSASLERHLRMGWNIFSEEVGDFIIPLPPQKRVHEDWYRGTADAVYQNIYFIDKIKPEEVLILSGDHVYAMDYRDMLHFHRARGAELTVGAIPVNGNQAHQFGIIETDRDGRIIGFREKPPFVSGRPFASMGVYIFNRQTLYKQLEEDSSRNTPHDFGKDIIPNMIGKGQAYAYPFVDKTSGKPLYWRDVGTIEAYFEAQMDLLFPHSPLNLYNARWPIRTYQGQFSPARVVPSTDGVPQVATIVNSIISPGCLIRGAVVENSILSPEVQIDANATVRESIILEGVRIGAGARVRRAIIDKFATIPAGIDIGYDPVRDRERFLVSETGIVVIPRGENVSPIIKDDMDALLPKYAPFLSNLVGVK